MMNRLFKILSVLLLACLCTKLVYSACSVNPLTIIETMKPGEVKVYDISIKNLDNTSHEYKLVISGKIINYSLVSESLFTLPANTSKIVKNFIIIPTDSKDGVYDGYIQVYEDNVVCAQIYEKITISSWVYETKKWIPIPSSLSINNYKLNITYTPDKNGIEINGETMYRDDVKVFYDSIRITVLDINRENNQVYLDIETKFSNPSISVQQLESIGEVGGIPSMLRENVMLYPSFTTKRIQQGVRSTSYVLYFYNGLPEKVQIIRVDVSGDQYIFEDGTSEPVVEAKPAVPTAVIQPGDQIPIVVKLSATKLEPGSYTVTITITYKVGNVIRYKSAILNIIVFESKYLLKNVEIEMPDSIRYSEPFVLKVKNVDERYDVKINFSNPNCVIGSGSFTNNEYVYNGKVICNINKLGISVEVYKNGLLVKKEFKNYIVSSGKSYQIKLDPQNPKPGDKVNIYVVDPSGNIISDAKIFVNGLPMTSFIAEANKRYTIIAEIDGQKISKTIQVSRRKMKVVIVPPNPKLGDTVTIKVFDFYTNEPINATIKVNGKVINGTFNVTHGGSYTIVVTAKGYQTFSKVINVPVPLKINISNEIKLGETIYATANKPVNWEIYYKEKGGLVMVFKTDNPTKTISYKPNKPGTYLVRVGGKEYTVNVVRASPPILGYAILLGLLAALLIGIRKVLRRFRRKTYKTVRRTEVKPIDVHKLPEGFPAQPLSEEEEKKVEELEKKEE